MGSPTRSARPTCSSRARRPTTSEYGNSFSNDGLPDLKADYLISNPPFGVDWSKAHAEIKDRSTTSEATPAGSAPGFRRKNDGSLLFLLHMLSEDEARRPGWKPSCHRLQRLAPLHRGSAGSGESEIRRWIIENDLLEAIVALPDQMFYNTGISTYIWLLTNRKAPQRRGKVQLINGVSYFQKMRKSARRQAQGAERRAHSPPNEALRRVRPGDGARGRKGVRQRRTSASTESPWSARCSSTSRRLRSESRGSKTRVRGRTFSRARRRATKAEADIAEGQALQKAVLAVLRAVDATKVYKSRPAFVKALKAEAKAQGVEDSCHGPEGRSERPL